MLLVAEGLAKYILIYIGYETFANVTKYEKFTHLKQLH